MRRRLLIGMPAGGGRSPWDVVDFIAVEVVDGCLGVEVVGDLIVDRHTDLPSVVVREVSVGSGVNDAVVAVVPFQLRTDNGWSCAA